MQKTLYSFREYVYIILIGSCILLLTSCSNTQQSDWHRKAERSETLTKQIPSQQFLGKTILPIKKKKDYYYKINGWISNETLLFTENDNKLSNLYLYNLYNGKKQKIYHTTEPISDVIISPNKDKILIKSSPTTHSGNLAILDLNGKMLASQKIDSFEIYLNWNSRNNDVLFVTAFYEDWTFDTYKYNIKNNELTKIEFSHPFAQWNNANEIVYLDWNKDDLILLAPLKKVSIQTKEQTTLLDNVFHFNVFSDTLLAIQINENNMEEGTYLFFNRELEKLSELTVPLLSSYSEWFIPPFDYVEINNTVLFLSPYYSAEADLYKDGFKLIQYGVNSGKQSILFEKLEQGPISCSENGKLCLYGYQFEQIMNISERTITQLLES